MDKANQTLLESHLQQNNQELFVLTPEEFEGIQQQTRIRVLDGLKTAAGYTSTVMDAKTALDQVREFGVGGRVVEKASAANVM